MSRRVLIVTAVQAEADVIGRPNGSFVVVGGIGRTNAAAATTAAMMADGPFTWVINAGVAGVLPHNNLSLGDVVIADKCIYAEEGLMTKDGFQDMQQMGFELGNFEGNEVPVDKWMLEQLGSIGNVASIATVATCSGSDEQANLIQERTGSACEAMEGAAVVHAAQRLCAPAIEIRVISNTTGNRETQEWDLDLALANLGDAVQASITALWGE
ncbi:MAG TPA: futalosine hydrolase [Phycisphaerales bacterium]|nr:futalosine hydrolase [Phycisphaerales bacterium]HIO52843.1 futalosine hydrolase [Phycisphaerales bacterium]